MDEAYLNVPQQSRTLRDAGGLAHTIQTDILPKTRLTFSAGTSINKFLAKLASGLHWNKPKVPGQQASHCWSLSAKG